MSMYSQAITIGFILLSSIASFNCSREKIKWSVPANENLAIIKVEPDTENIFRRYDRVKKAVKEWNNAISNNQMDALEKLYTDTISYYGKTLSKKECIDKKTKWLGEHIGYKQQLKDLQVYYNEMDTNYSVFIAEFEKICIDNGKSTTVNSFLYFKKLNGEWKITAETDQPTELNKAKNAPASTLKKGKLNFYRGYWVDTRDMEGFGHEQVPYRAELNLAVGDKITGTAYTYSGTMRSTDKYSILDGKIENGMLNLTVVFLGNSAMEMDSDTEPKKEYWHFKIINGNELVGTDKDNYYFYGYSLLLIE